MIYSKTWTCKCVYNIIILLYYNFNTAMYKYIILHMKYVYAQKYIVHECILYK